MAPSPRPGHRCDGNQHTFDAESGERFEVLEAFRETGRDLQRLRIAPAIARRLTSQIEQFLRKLAGGEKPVT